ncbi:MAG TPA: hypothetical protein VK053_13295 [Jiangellaceae bacterium]|nr:hypothetical protein [Jiangellaceae bacterium]
MPILPRERDPHLITLRRGGSLTDEHHRMLTAHDLGAAAYAIRAAVAAASRDQAEPVRLAERDGQRQQVPAELRELVLADQAAHSPICWPVFDD